MENEFILNELAIVIAAKSHNPTILNPDFLKRNRIVPDDWELNSPDKQFSSVTASQVVYNNGISIQAQYEKVLFSENITGKEYSDFQIPNVAREYVKNLPHVSYTAVGINPKGYVQVPSNEDAENFVMNKLIQSGPWKLISEVQPIVSATFIYRLENCNIGISIMNDQIQIQKENDVPIIAFTSNFHRDLEITEGQKGLDSILKNWTDDLETFKSIVNSFLSKE
jgi:hypothetical protein